MRLIVHIGRTKTGTSHLQSVFATNASLLAEHGLSYQEFGKKVDIDIAARGGITSGNAVLLALSYCAPSLLPDNQDPADVREEFYQKCRAITMPDVLISSEFFERLGELSVRYLKKLANRLDRELVLVVYIRDQEQAMQSIYAQGVKRHNETAGPRTFLEKLDWDTLRYYDWLKTLADEVGGNNLIVRPYEKTQFYQNRIEADFFHAIGYADDVVNKLSVPSRVVNPTPSAKDLQFLRIANRYQPPFEMSNALLDLYNMRKRHEYNKNAIFKMDDVDRIRAHFREDNKRVYQEFVRSSEDRPDRDELFLDQSRSYELGQASDDLDISLEDFFDIFTGLLVTLFKKSRRI